MDRERGFVEIDVIGLLLAASVIGVLVGFVLCPLLSWAWSIVKPWLHSITG